MKNSFGSAITVTLFGESHGEYIGAVLDGIAPGIRIDTEHIKKRLSQRRPQGKISTARVEADEFVFASGVYGEFTTGTPLSVIIPNTNKNSKDYSSLLVKPRPGHADYTAGEKYHGFQDPRGGGHFSGRLTAALVAVGAILETALLSKGIRIGSHIASLHGISDRCFDCLEKDIAALGEKHFPVLSETSEKEMRREIEEAAERGDSVGGILETAVIGVPTGIGEPWFDTLEGMLAHGLFSIPAIKGVEFGSGFGLAELYGSEANDPFAFKDGRVVTESNRNGGINGGISNGMPITFRCAVKPTPSIFTEQKTVDLEKRENTILTVTGRHDPAIIHRARAVVDAMTAIVLADALTVRFGTDYLANF